MSRVRLCAERVVELAHGHQLLDAARAGAPLRRYPRVGRHAIQSSIHAYSSRASSRAHFVRVASSSTITLLRALTNSDEQAWQPARRVRHHAQQQLQQPAPGQHPPCPNRTFVLDCQGSEEIMRDQVDPALVRRAAGRIWAERVNPIYWEVKTPLGAFRTSDRATWRTAASDWTAELRRSRHGHHTYMALFEGGVYRGRYDDAGWHDASNRSRVRQLRSYQLPLAA